MRGNPATLMLEGQGSEKWGQRIMRSQRISVSGTATSRDHAKPGIGVRNSIGNCEAKATEPSPGQTYHSRKA